MTRPSTLRGAAAGAAAGLLACVTGVGYILDNSDIPGISWSTVGAVFVTQLLLTGAVFGALVTRTRAMLDRRIGRRTSWAPPLAASIATAIAAVPAGAFGAAYFGSLHAPFMGTSVIFSIAAIIAVGLAGAMAWLDQVEDDSLATAPRLRRALFASIGLALPVVAIGGALAAATPDREVLHAFRSTSPALLGGLSAAGLGLVFGLYAGLVVGVVRRLGKQEQPRVRVAAALPPLASILPAKKVEAVVIDPLAEEDEELEARFAELDRLEKARFST